ncbi:MAG: molybdopterin cofactor-binding domain-containing protein, partial [Pseudomonadota bacterium]
AAAHYGVSEADVTFVPNAIVAGEQTVAFKDLVHQAWMGRVNLSANGFYKTPKIHYNKETLSGRPFYYYAYGAAVSEVIIDTLTGELRVTRVDIVHDCGDSLNPAIDLGQIEGGFIQGMGWLTTEHLWWDDHGSLRTHAPATYKIPACSDVPQAFNVAMLSGMPNREETIHRSKAVGEPPLMLAISVFQAIKDAVSACAPAGGPPPPLEAPATPEHILNAVMAARHA